MQAGSCERQSQTGPEKQLHEINPAGHHPRRFRRRSYLVSGTIFLRALLNFAGLALLIPVLLLILDSESMHTNPWLERLYQAGGFESDRAFALTVCGCIVALIAFKTC